MPPRDNVCVAWEEEITPPFLAGPIGRLQRYKREACRKIRILETGHDVGTEAPPGERP